MGQASWRYQISCTRWWLGGGALPCRRRKGRDGGWWSCIGGTGGVLDWETRTRELMRQEGGRLGSRRRGDGAPAGGGEGIKAEGVAPAGLGEGRRRPFLPFLYYIYFFNWADKWSAVHLSNFILFLPTQH
jgi:hypothetical protein